MTIQDLENVRVKCKKNRLIGIFIIVPSLILLFLGFNIEVLVFLSILGVITGFIFFGIAQASFNKVRKNFKTQFLKPEIEKRYPGVEYCPEKGFDEVFINSLGLYKKPDRFHSEDLLSGKINDVSFMCCDVNMQERHVHHTKNGTTVTYETYFQGKYYLFDFNKPFKDTILLTESIKPSAYSKLQKVEMESLEFNKKFKTFCLDKINAFYVLTPQVMLAFLELEKQNPGHISLVITGSNMYMAINNRKDSFELSMNRVVDESFVQYYMRDIKSIENIIDCLNLDDKTFKEIAEDLAE